MALKGFESLCSPRASQIISRAVLARELAGYQLRYRIVANKCKTQEIYSSAYRKYQIRWKEKLVQKTGSIIENI